MHPHNGTVSTSHFVYVRVDAGSGRGTSPFQDEHAYTSPDLGQAYVPQMLQSFFWCRVPLMADPPDDHGRHTTQYMEIEHPQELLQMTGSQMIASTEPASNFSHPNASLWQTQPMFQATESPAYSMYRMSDQHGQHRKTMQNHIVGGAHSRMGEPHHSHSNRLGNLGVTNRISSLSNSSGHPLITPALLHSTMTHHSASGMESVGDMDPYNRSSSQHRLSRIATPAENSLCLALSRTVAR